MSDQPAPSASAPQPSADRPDAASPRPPESSGPSKPSGSSRSSGPSKPPGSAKPPRPPRRGGGALAVLALLLALLALAAVAFGGWHWWQGRQVRQHDRSAVAQLQKQVRQVRQAQAGAAHQRQSENKARQQLEASNQSLQQQVAGLSGRVDSLDGAVAGLARQQRHGREALLMDQAAMLLRMGQQRYRLFHDAAGAGKALALADQTLAAVHDPDLTGVRQTLAAERKALAATHPASRAADLATLAKLRATVPTLPLKPLDAGNTKPAAHGFWSRVWHALSTAVVIRRDHGSVPSLADARLTRQLAALDLAQAQAARLAWDADGAQAALQRVAKALDTAFDTRDAGVRKARAAIAHLLAEKPASAPELGQALQQLDNLRDVRDAAGPAAPTSAAVIPHDAPAPAGTSA